MITNKEVLDKLKKIAWKDQEGYITEYEASRILHIIHRKENEELNLSNIYKTTQAIKDFIEIDLGTGKYIIDIQDLDEELIRLRKENEEMRRHNKVRIIDIFTKIANGEKVPKKIKYNCLEKGYEVLVYDEEAQEYRFENDMDNFLTVPNHHLKDRIEILEE